jgi:tetratricopeptide (TPR) repeat protein
VAGAVEEFRGRQRHHWPGLILLGAGRIYLAAGRVDEAEGHAREALALAQRLEARGSEAQALCLNGDIAAAASAEDATGYYRQALGLAEPRGMRPLVAQCHLGLGKLFCRSGDRGRAREHLSIAMAMYREMGMTYWQQQAEAELRQLGLAPRHPFSIIKRALASPPQPLWQLWMLQESDEHIEFMPECGT